MSLEATMLVLDNSSYSINGDFTRKSTRSLYPPPTTTRKLTPSPVPPPATRLEAQSDAVHVVFSRKLSANPESEVGLMVMAGQAPQVLVTPTQDEGKLIAALHTIQPSGQADLDTAIKVAQLALKHRQNKNQRQRIIVFCASPITTTAATLSKLGKKMKKNNVAIDIVAFGSSSDSPDAAALDLAIPCVPSSSSSSTSPSTVQEPNSMTTASETTHHKLTTLYEAVNSSDNSHMLLVEPGPYLLSERISQSPILRGPGAANDEYSHLGASGGVGGGQGGGDEDGFGVDPNLDPELAMALRMSLQEERARQQALEEAKAKTVTATAEKGETIQEEEEEEGTAEGAAGAGVAAGAMETDAPISGDAETGTELEDVEIDEDGDDDLAKALALSRGAEEGQEGDVEMEEEQEMARAIAMSMQEAQENETKEAKKDGK